MPLTRAVAEAAGKSESRHFRAVDCAPAWRSWQQAVRRALLWRTAGEGDIFAYVRRAAGARSVAAPASWFRWAATGVRLIFEQPPLRAKCTDPVTVLACNSCAGSTLAGIGRTERRSTEIRARGRIRSGPTVHPGSAHGRCGEAPASGTSSQNGGDTTIDHSTVLAGGLAWVPAHSSASVEEEGGSTFRQFVGISLSSL